MMDTIKKRAPFHLKHIPPMAGLDEDSFASWSSGRRPVPDDVFPSIAAALDQKAADLKRLAREIRKRYPTPPE